MESRYNDTTLVRCEACGWQGQAIGCRHSYAGYGGLNPATGEFEGDVEPIDYCPECGTAEPIPIEQEPADV